MPNDLVIVSRRVVTPAGERPAGVVVVDGRITAVVDPGALPSGPRHDVGDLALLPGLVDTHVHVNEPGRTHWEGFETATRAAAAGGVTTLVDMPLNSLPPTLDEDALALKRAAAQPNAHIDVAFWGGVVPGSENHLEALHAAGVLGFKAFLCDSGVPEYGDFSPALVTDLARRIAALGALLIVHAEDPGVVAAATAAVAASGADPRSYRTWLDGRPAAAEVAAVDALIEAARVTGARIHVLHLSAADAADAIAAASAEGVSITAETCPHYLTIAAEDVPDGATDHKCAPPIRERANQERLWAALAAGTIDAIVSDHSPCPPQDKALDRGDFVAAWGGIASLQLGLPLVWTAASARGHGLPEVVGWMADGPARIAGMTTKGRIEVGADADLVVFDPDAQWVVDPATLHHRHPVSPYAGRTVRGVVHETYLGGVPVGGASAGAAGSARGRLRTRGAL